MTANQLRYWELQEQKRSNQAKESETHRANVVSEEETHRRNKADETIRWTVGNKGVIGQLGDLVKSII